MSRTPWVYRDGAGATRVTGQRTVRVAARYWYYPYIRAARRQHSAESGRLPHGFDLKNADGSVFVNAYTDISRTRLNVRTRTATVENDPVTTP